MRYLRFLTFIITISAFTQSGLTSCNNDDSTTLRDTIYADPEFLNWWWFNEGSWWVYKRIDDTSQMLFDTAVVTLKTTKSGFEPRISDSIITVYYLHLKHSSQYFKDKGSLNEQILNTSGTYGTALISDSRSNTTEHIDYFSFRWILKWPLKYDFNIEDQNGVSLLDSNRLGDPILNYPTLHYKNGLTNGEVWISETIGITKYKFGYDGSVWELINYKIQN